MLFSNRKFDLFKLVLRNMIDVFEGNSSTGLSYGLLLTRIFDWYGVDFADVDK